MQDTFYHKEITDLRPTFEIVNDTIKGVESLNNLFTAPVAISEDNEYENDNPDDAELEEEEKQIANAQGLYL